MKNRLKICALALSLSCSAFGADAANDLILSQRKADNSRPIQRNLAPVANGIFGFDGSLLPDIKLIGTDLQAWSTNLDSWSALSPSTKANLSGGNTWSGVQAFPDAVLVSENTLGAFVIDTAKGDNRKTISASQAFTFSTDAPTTGTEFPFTVTNSGGSAATVTLTSATPIFSVNHQAVVTAFNVLAGGTESVYFRKEASRFVLHGAPTTLNDLVEDETPSTSYFVQVYNPATGATNKAELGSLPGASIGVSDAAYSQASWDGDTTGAASKNAISDQFENLIDPIPIAYLSTDGTLGGVSPSDTKVPTEAAVSEAISNAGSSGDAVGSIKLWSTADIANRPSDWLLSDGNNGTVNLTSASSALSVATYIVRGSGTVANPTFSPVAGSYDTTQNVTISTATSGATIKYTTDDSAPTRSNGTTYSTPISVSTTDTLKAIAYKDLAVDSTAETAAYVISADLINEDFEGTGAPAGWTPTPGTGAVDWDYTTSPIEGTQSLRLTAGAKVEFTSLFAAQDDISVFVRIRKVIQATLNNTPIVGLGDALLASQGSLRSRVDTTHRVYHGTANDGTGGGIANATNLAVWLDYTKASGGGGNGLATVYIQTNGTETKPGTPYGTAITTGTSTGDIASLLLSALSGGEFVFDKVIVRAGAGTIGSNP